MFKFKNGFIIFCVIAFLGIIVFLLIINWNAETWVPYLSPFIAIPVILLIANKKKNWATALRASALVIFILALITLAVMLLITLKESNIEDSFRTSIPINEETHLPPLFNLDRTNKKAILISKLSSLARPTETINDKEFTYFDLPKDTNETFSFYEELLQYQLIRDIREFHLEHLSILQGIGVFQIEEHKPFKPKEAIKFTEIAGTDILLAISKNRFSKKQSEQFYWKYSVFSLPPKTQLILQPSSEETGPEKRKIIFRKPYFFEIEIIIEPLFAVDLRSVPEYLNIPVEKVKKYKLYLFEITMKAKFERITAGSPETKEYKRWANWLFSEIQNKYSVETENVK